jgi:methoxymalonate biosynthesis acyl carrier protein
MHGGSAAERAVAQLFLERLEVGVPSGDTDLFETGILDSLRFVELLAALEERFGMRVSVEELELDDFRTLSRIAAFVARKAGLAPVAGA